MKIFALEISVIKLDKGGFSLFSEEFAGPDGFVLFFLVFGVGMPDIFKVNKDVILLPFVLGDIGFEHSFLFILLEGFDEILSIVRV